MFDGRFIPATSPGTEWHHEMASVDMFDHMLESNFLKGEFYERGLTDTDIQFIKEQIAGPLDVHPRANVAAPAVAADTVVTPARRRCLLFILFLLFV